MAEPLPYIIRLRTVTNDDAPSVVVEEKIIAYSAMEACMQAAMMATGRGVDGNVKVEFIGPDVEAWHAMQKKKEG